MQQNPTAPPRSGLPRWIVPVVLGVVLLVAAALVFNALQPSRAEQAAGPAGVGSGIPIPTAGTRIEPPRALNSFTLTNQDGEPMGLEDFKGKPTIIYFGYTFCPDVCPTTLADVVRVKRELGDQADQVNFVMVSVDGERDTPEVLKLYLSNFDESFIGLTAPPSEIRKISPDFGVFFQKNEVAGTSAAYLVDHSAALYLVDAEGRLHTIYGYGIPPEVVLADVQAMLAAG